MKAKEIRQKIDVSRYVNETICVYWDLDGLMEAVAEAQLQKLQADEDKQDDNQ